VLDAAPTHRRPARVALGLYAVVTAIFLLTSAPELRRTHTPYNHFALLAEAWLHGRLDLGGAPPAYTGNNDFALFEGRHYVSFPPFPALLLVPSVYLAGGAAKVRDGAFFLSLAGIAPAVLFLALERLSALGRSARTLFENAALALLFGLGSVYWFTAVQGTVWFAAHVVGAALCAGFLWASVGAERPVLAGLCLGLGFATRTPLAFAAPFFLYEAFVATRDEERRSFALLRKLALFAAPATVVLGLLLWHNVARFGQPLEFGHGLLTVAWRARIEKWGLFSTHYLGRNLSIVLAGLPFSGTAEVPFRINAHGLALWLTTPIYAWALWPKRASGVFVALALSAFAVALPSLCYQNSGWTQFGYRFSNDFAPLLFALIAVGKRRFSWPFWLLAAVSLVVNGFGALTFQRAAYGSYYFVDGTQRVVTEPD
jgi:hypothetical protein